MDEITEYFIGKLTDANYKLGYLVQKEYFSRFLLKQSSQYFENGNDNLADVFRDLSKKLEKECEEERMEYNKTWYKIKDDVWKILDDNIGNIDYPENLKFNYK